MDDHSEFKMVDLKRDNTGKSFSAYPTPSLATSGPDYSYGLCLHLDKQELDKLGLDPTDIRPGEVIHLHAMAKVTSVHESAGNDESDSKCTMEMQITHMVVEQESKEEEPDDEDEENEEAEEQMGKGLKHRTNKMYGKY